jgi:hypothetical protein
MRVSDHKMSASLHHKADPNPVGYLENSLIMITFMLFYLQYFQYVIHSSAIKLKHSSSSVPGISTNNIIRCSCALSDKKLYILLL